MIVYLRPGRGCQFDEEEQQANNSQERPDDHGDLHERRQGA